MKSDSTQNKRSQERTCGIIEAPPTTDQRVSLDHQRQWQRIRCFVRAVARNDDLLRASVLVLRARLERKTEFPNPSLLSQRTLSGLGQPFPAKSFALCLPRIRSSGLSDLILQFRDAKLSDGIRGAADPFISDGGSMLVPVVEIDVRPDCAVFTGRGSDWWIQPSCMLPC